jgi:hypothetical protein
VVAPMAGGATTRELAPWLDARVVRFPARWKRARVGIGPCGAASERAGQTGIQPPVLRSILVDLVQPDHVAASPLTVYVWRSQVADEPRRIACHHRVGLDVLAYHRSANQ